MGSEDVVRPFLCSFIEQIYIEYLFCVKCMLDSEDNSGERD